MLTSAQLTPASENGEMGNSQYFLTPGLSGEWLLIWATASPNNVYALGLQVSGNGVLTRDTSPLFFGSIGQPSFDSSYEMLSAIYGVTEDRYLLTYTTDVTNPRKIGVAALKRNSANTGFDAPIAQNTLIASDLDGDNNTDQGGFADVTHRSLIDVVDTSTGWMITFGVGSRDSERALWTTVTLVGNTLTFGTPIEVSTSASGQVLHPAITSTSQGELITFRYDSGVDGNDRYQVRGRWITGINASATDLIFASYSDPISRVRATYSGTTVGLVWNITHNYAAGAERVVIQEVPLSGSTGDPVLVASNELVQQRPDVTWSTALNRFLVTWIQKDADDEWSVWLSGHVSTIAPEDSNGSDSVPEAAASSGGTSTVTETPSTTPAAKITTVLSGMRVIKGFANRSPQLTSSFKATLRRFVKAHPDATSFKCTGYTASDRVLKYHPRLAKARAKAVCDYIAKLAPGATISTSGKTPIGRLGSQNRKVLVRVYKSSLR